MCSQVDVTAESLLLSEVRAPVTTSLGSDVEMIAANNRSSDFMDDSFCPEKHPGADDDVDTTSITSSMADSTDTNSTGVSGDERQRQRLSSGQPSFQDANIKAKKNSLLSSSPRSTLSVLAPEIQRQGRCFTSATSTAMSSAAPAIATEEEEEPDKDQRTEPKEGEMKDEYGQMDDSGLTYVYPNGDYVLENGQVLPHAQIRYQTYGTLDEESRDNVLVVCHALTGNASLHTWWGEMLGPGLAFDTDKYFVVCCNILGSCYGSTGPRSVNPATGEPYGVDFPDISVRDTVRLQLQMIQEGLGVRSIKCVIGGSFGGMQAMEYAVQAGSDSGDFFDEDGNPFVRSVLPIACGTHHTAWQIGVSEVQRQAIYRDPEWIAGNYFDATSGLEIARQLGMVSYRTPVGYVNKFSRKIQGGNDGPRYGSNANWSVKSYLEYQGQKFLSRFDPVTYVKMTEQMDSHDVARGRVPSSYESKHHDEQLRSVLQDVNIPACVLGIDSDVLYPLAEQQAMADALPNSTLHIISSDDGHDGFLLEQDQVADHIVNFLRHHY